MAAAATSVPIRRRRPGLESIAGFIHLLTTVEGISEIIRFGGLVLLILIVFAETGLLVGFFLPGDSLLVTAGFLAATTDVLSIGPVVVTLSLAAILGDSTGYYIGASVNLLHRFGQFSVQNLLSLSGHGA
jgi:membrane protein DedA with SNARE-associated domain